MKPTTARAAGNLLLLLAAAGWLWIVYIAADPAGDWGKAWFELALGHIAVTGLALLARYVLGDLAAWRVRLARAVLSVLALLLAVALVELPAAVGLIDYRRLIIPRVMGGTGPHNRRFDPELIYTHFPHDRFTHRQVGDYAAGLAIPRQTPYEAECRYDAHGFRNSCDLDRADVVLLGDSFIEGYNVTQSDIVSSEFQRLAGCQVANLALCGYGPQQQLAALRRYGLPLKPRVVVWFFYEGNDLTDIAACDSVYANWDGYVAAEQNYTARSLVFNILEPLGFWFDQLRWRQSDLARRRCGQVRGVDSSMSPSTYFGDPPAAMTEHTERLFGRLQGILREAKQTCDEHGIRLLVAVVPAKGRVYQGLCDFPADSDVPGWRWSDLPSRLCTWCGESKINFLDIEEPLRTAAREGVMVYLRDDPHWSPEGHAIVAKELSRWLKGTAHVVPHGHTMHISLLRASSPATESRKTIARGASPWTPIFGKTNSPERAAEASMSCCFRPSGASETSRVILPGAFAPGYCLSPLRGCAGGLDSSAIGIAKQREAFPRSRALPGNVMLAMLRIAGTAERPCSPFPGGSLGTRAYGNGNEATREPREGPP